MTESRNLVPWVGLALVVALFLYGWSVAGASATGSPLEVLGLLGSALLFAAIAGTLSTMWIAARRASRERRWLWVALVILVWPLSYLYTLALDRRG